MIYNIYSDERERNTLNSTIFFIGGIVCTKVRANILELNLNKIKIEKDFHSEFKWTKISKYHLKTYKLLVDVFFHDPHARFFALKIDKSSLEWNKFAKDKGYSEAMKSLYYQLLINTFKSRSDDTIGWHVLHDFGFFSKESDIKQIEFKLNKIYKRIAPKRARVVHMSTTVDSKKVVLIQLADILLGAIDFLVLQKNPDSLPRSEYLKHVKSAYIEDPKTERGLEKITIFEWVPPEVFDYKNIREINLNNCFLLNQI